MLDLFPDTFSSFVFLMQRTSLATRLVSRTRRLCMCTYQVIYESIISPEDCKTTSFYS